MTLPELLKAAAEIKTAQLKSRPGRQEWEHSPDWIKYTAYHDAEDANAALRLYTRALSIFVWFDRGKDRASQDIPYINTLATAAAAAASGCTPQLEPEVLQANQTVATLFSNAANCLLKTQASADSVVYACK
ncbi:TPR_REGION domain-containing protein, partial [Haematococcus lacustris]